MLAHAILTVIAERERQRHRSGQPGLIPLTVNEIRRLFAKLICVTRHPAFIWPGRIGGAATKPAKATTVPAATPTT
jgi:hypothetical protein